MKYIVLLSSALFFLVANLRAEPLISADDKKQTNESKTSQSAKKTSTKNVSTSKAFSILLDAGKNKVADDAKQKNLNAKSNTPVYEPLSDQTRKQFERSRLDTSIVTTPYKPSLLTPVPRTDCGPNAIFTKTGENWQCVEQENRKPQGNSMWIAAVINWDVLTEVHFINPGNVVNKVDCLVFNRLGRLRLDLSYSQSVTSGGFGSCMINFLERGEALSEYGNPRLDRLWVLLVAERPILPNAYAIARQGGTGDYSGGDHHLSIYPLDCSDASGFEFACNFALDARSR